MKKLVEPAYDLYVAPKFSRKETPVTFWSGVAMAVFALTYLVLTVIVSPSVTALLVFAFAFSMQSIIVNIYKQEIRRASSKRWMSVQAGVTRWESYHFKPFVFTNSGYLIINEFRSGGFFNAVDREGNEVVIKVHGLTQNPQGIGIPGSAGYVINHDELGVSLVERNSEGRLILQ